MTLPHRKSAASDSMNRTQSARCDGSPKSPAGIGNDRMSLASDGMDSCCSSSGVLTAPGAIALRRMPSPIQAGLVAAVRTQWLTATLEAAYANGGVIFGPKSRSARTAPGPSPASSDRIARRGTRGVVVVELLANTTTLAASAFARAGRQARSSSTTPK